MKNKMMLIVAAVAVLIIGALYMANSSGKTPESATDTNDVSVAEVQNEEVEAVEPIRIGTSGGYKPYTFIDENNELTGFDVDVWKEIGSRMDRDVEFVTADFSGLFGLLDSGKITTIANQITVNEKRLEKYDFSQPYVYYGAQLVVKGDNDEVYDLETLKGKKVGVSLGSNYEEMVRSFDTNQEINVITYESYQASLQDVSLGRIDAVLNDRLAAIVAIGESGLDIKLGGEPVELMHNAFPFVKSDETTVLLEGVDDAIISMYADGTMKDISMKWFGVDITEK